MAEAVYILCGLTSLVCAALLLRTFLRERTRLLFWASICFFALSLNNVLLFVDLVLVPNIDLFMWRTIPALVGTGALLGGLIWDSR